MKVNAYIMLGEPEWLGQAVLSLYPLVDRLIVSYDEDGLGWTGAELPIGELLDVVRGLDDLQKIVEAPGRYRKPGTPLMEQETAQRQAAIEVAEAGADWVLQLDTDEVVTDVNALERALGDAASADRQAVKYPARWLYARPKPGWYLERCRRTWQHSAGYPGPIAVRPGTRLRHARQCDGSTWTVDLKRQGTDKYSGSYLADSTVNAKQAIAHLSWVRSEANLRTKMSNSGHAKDAEWSKAIDQWVRRNRRPWLAAAGTPFRRDPMMGGAQHLRYTRWQLPFVDDGP